VDPAIDAEPIQHFAIDSEMTGKRGGQEVADPGADCHDRTVGVIGLAIGSHGHGAAIADDIDDPFVAMQGCPMPLRELELCADARLGAEETGIALEVAVLIAPYGQGWESTADLAGIEQLVLNAELPGGIDRPLEKTVPPRAFAVRDRFR